MSGTRMYSKRGWFAIGLASLSRSRLSWWQQNLREECQVV